MLKDDLENSIKTLQTVRNHIHEIARRNLLVTIEKDLNKSEYNPTIEHTTTTSAQPFIKPVVYLDAVTKELFNQAKIMDNQLLNLRSLLTYMTTNKLFPNEASVPETKQDIIL